jgi:hypothetical protein
MTDTAKDSDAVAMAKKRSDSLTPERRSEISQKAVKARWAKRKRKASAAGESASLLEKAIAIEKERVVPEPDPPDSEMIEMLELALAYNEGKVYSRAVGAALGIEGNKVSSWFSSIIMRGIRAGHVEIKLKKIKG